MKTNVKLTILTILALVFGCERNNIDYSIEGEKDNLMYQYEVYNIDPYLAIKKQEGLAAKEHYQSISNRLKSISNVSPKTSKSQKIKITVPDDYVTIQEAVNAAPEDAVIKIKGNFTEVVNIWGKTNLALIGEENASVESNEYAFSVYLSNNIKIKNLTVRGHITIWESEQITIKNNDISGSSAGYGLYMYKSIYCTIKENYIHDLTGNNLERGGGVYLAEDNDFNNIQGNHITRARLGIELLYDSDNNEIKDNYVSDTRWTGISLVTNCDQNKVKDNTITRASWAGLTVVDNSNDNDIKGITTSFSNGTPTIPGFRVAGIGILNSSNNSVIDVKTFKNTNGIILAENSDNNLIKDLKIINNSILGLQLEPATSLNIIKDSQAKKNGQCDLLDQGAKNSFKDSKFKIICE